MTVRIINADVMDGLAQLPDESVHCVVTSPPYWGLRDYGTPGQIGLEPTLGEHIEAMVLVFREVKRVLRKDGTLWLNYGDSYNSGGNPLGEDKVKWSTLQGGKATQSNSRRTWDHSLKPKDLCGVPWRVAFALQADGWWLRQDIIWSKPNPMPESIKDRCTKAHEYLFLLAKSERYYFDAEAIAEAATYANEELGIMRGDKCRALSTGREPSGNELAAVKRRESKKRGEFNGKTGDNAFRAIRETRNKRSVWEIATQPFPEAHFATFPPALIEPCIKAGSSERGCCAKCGASWLRQIERVKDRPQSELRGKYAEPSASVKIGGGSSTIGHSNWHDGRHDALTVTTGWEPSCLCSFDAMHLQRCVPCTVLDPFGGSGTTGLVADRLKRNAILIELNPAYAQMAQKRIANDNPLFTEVSVA